MTIMLMKEIIGKTILGFELNARDTGRFETTTEDGELVLICAEGRFIYQTADDACNKVWFSDINPPAKFPCTVLTVKTDNEADEDEWGNNIKFTENEISICDYEDIAFIHIETNQGVFTIEIRNSHNGYYGGSIRFKGVE